MAQRWYTTYQSAGETGPDLLIPAERAWLAEHPDIVLGVGQAVHERKMFLVGRYSRVGVFEPELGDFLVVRIAPEI